VRLLRLWLCHSDARQVSDLPSIGLLFFERVSDPLAVIDRRNLEEAFRQVRDLPRISVPEALATWPHFDNVSACINPFELFLEMAAPTFRQRFDLNRALQQSDVFLVTCIEACDVADLNTLLILFD